MNGEVNGAMEESMDTTSPPTSPASIKKVASEVSDVANNHCEDSNNTENSNHAGDSDHNQTDEPGENSNSHLLTNDNSNASSVSRVQEDSNSKPAAGNNTENHCINSNESYSESNDSSQHKNSKGDTKDANDVEMEYEKEAKAVTTNDESDEEVDSEEDSSEEEGSEASEEPRAEDTVSINSDSEPEAIEDDSTQEGDPKDKSNDVVILDNLNTSESHNGDEVHEIVSDNDNDDCIVTNDDKTNESTSDSKSEPRRSARTIKRKKFDDELENGDGESDIEEILEDPLTEGQRKSKPIVINDTKELVEMASKQSKGSQKKEPTVVIIDTNSILSGKSGASGKNLQASTSSANSQNLYESIAARGTTVTPVGVKSSLSTQASTTTQPIILPSLTDDMFVVEAPSFIVPYVYEKPSIKPFREFVDILGKELENQRAKEEAERLIKEKEETEEKEKERQERKDRGEQVSEEEEEEVMKEEKEKKEEKEEKDAKDEKEEDTLKKTKEKKGRQRVKNDDDDKSWDGESTSDSEDDVISGDEAKTVVIKEKDDDDIEEIKDTLTDPTADIKTGAKSDSYFDNSLGKFFIDVGVNLVQEFVQHDLLKQQKRKLHKESRSGGSNVRATEAAIASLSQNLRYSKETNAPYAFEQKKCEFCSFKTESILVMAHHLETPHMKNNVYKCNFCAFEIRSPHDILYHMEAEHNTRGRLERAPAYHQCANCPFEDNGKGKLARHLIPCAKKFKPELNLAPPIEWEPPAKIPKITRARNNMMGSYQSALNRGQVGAGITRAPINSGMMTGMVNNYRPRGRTPLSVGTPRATGPQPVHGAPLVRGGLMMRHNAPMVMSNNYPIMNQKGNNAGVQPKMLLHHQPSISITPLPRAPQPTPPQPQHAKGTFVICEICDGYIKDLEQLRNHMQWIHKVKIHPKMIYNRPPLNCQKCQFRFFTDQGLERHLLGSHGLVTSSMQEAANKGKDAGRCPVCGRVYQWKLLNHVARDHNLTLKPAHLSYKCTVCTATFGMYKQFENHVYSAHSVVAKRVMDKNKTPAAASPKPATSESLLKPLKINDEITIIPQPAKPAITKGKKD